MTPPAYYGFREKQSFAAERSRESRLAERNEKFVAARIRLWNGTVFTICKPSSAFGPEIEQESEAAA